MATSEMTITKTSAYTSQTRQRVLGILFLVVAFSIWFFFSRSVAPGVQTTFGLTPGGSEAQLPDWTFSTAPILNILAIVCAILGGAQLARGFGSRTNLVLAWVAGMFIFSFLAWAAADGSLNFAGLLRSSVVRAVPITIGALSGVLCERAGVVNIAIEGMMLTGAMMGALVGSLTNIWIGLLAAVIAGGLLGLVHAILSIRYKADQIISGTVINIGAVGITSFISAKFLQKYQGLNSSGIFPAWDIPVLSKIPFIGPILFEHNLFVYALFFLLILLHVGLFYTRWGLRMRSVGEHPKAADTLGINVFKTR